MSGFNLAARLIAQQRAGQGQGMGQMVSGLMGGFRQGMGQLREDKIRTENREEAQAERDMMRGEREQARTDRQAQQDYGRGLDLARLGLDPGEGNEGLQSIAQHILEQRTRTQREAAMREVLAGNYAGDDPRLRGLSESNRNQDRIDEVLGRAGVDANASWLRRKGLIGEAPEQVAPLTPEQREDNRLNALIRRMKAMGFPETRIREVIEREVAGAAPGGPGGEDPFKIPRRLGLERQLDIRESEDDLSPGRIRGDWKDLLEAMPMPGQQGPGRSADGLDRWWERPTQMPIESFGPPTQAPVRPAGEGGPGGVGPGGTVPAPNVGGLRGTPGGGGGGLVQMLGRLMGGGGEGGPPGLLPGPGGQPSFPLPNVSGAGGILAGELGQQAPVGRRNEEMSNIPPAGASGTTAPGLAGMREMTGGRVRPGAQMPQQQVPAAPTQQAPQEITQIAAKFMEVDPAMRKRILQQEGMATALATWAVALPEGSQKDQVMEALHAAGAFRE